MSHPSIDELKALIASMLSVEEVFEILNWEMSEFLDAIEEHVDEHYEEFLKATR